jgi:hypothetical protein
MSVYRLNTESVGLFPSSPIYPYKVHVNEDGTGSLLLSVQRPSLFQRPIKGQSSEVEGM